MSTRHCVITLGTAGAPKWWSPIGEHSRFGIATAVVVGDRTYLVDTGMGAARQLERAGRSINTLHGIFFTHLHSDHTVDLLNLVLFGMFDRSPALPPIPIIGPGDRQLLPPASPYATGPITPLSPKHPTPGTAAMFELLMAAYATDLNYRVLNALRASPLDLFQARDIQLPANIGFDPNVRPNPDMEPFEVFEDDYVHVDAILVQHPPVAPAFGYRFTTDRGSIAISGDTAPTPNVIRLAQDADLLLHEAIDFDWVEQVFGGATTEMGRAEHSHQYNSHTSVDGAIEIAIAAGARRLALHHLVPGNLKRDRWRAATSHSPIETIVPDDLDVLDW